MSNNQVETGFINGKPYVKIGNQMRIGGTRSWRNNSPGNIKFVGQGSAIGQDKGGFCIFPSYEVGFQALSNMIKRAASGESKVYKPNMTFVQFFNVYAPSSDKNDPDQYARVVAKACGVAITTEIRELIA